MHLFTQIERVINNSSMIKEVIAVEERNRGRTETRIVSVYGVSEEIQKDYKHCKSIISVKRIREISGNRSEEVMYYISDMELSAAQFNEGIRGHWSIENRLHYVKDVVMNEDRANMKNKQTATIMSLIRSFVIMIAYVFSKSVTNFQRTYAHNLDLIGVL